MYSSTRVVRAVVCKHHACTVVHTCSSRARAVVVIVALVFNCVQHPACTRRQVRCSAMCLSGRNQGPTVQQQHQQQQQPTRVADAAQLYGVSDSPFPFKWVCGPQELESLIGGGKNEYARPGINDGRVLNRQLLGEFGAVIKKPCPMGRKSNAR